LVRLEINLRVADVKTNSKRSLVSAVIEGKRVQAIVSAT
jgi:hypothetical protein